MPLLLILNFHLLYILLLSCCFTLLYSFASFFHVKGTLLAFIDILLSFIWLVYCRCIWCASSHLPFLFSSLLLFHLTIYFPSYLMYVGVPLHWCLVLSLFLFFAYLLFIYLPVPFPIIVYDCWGSTHSYLYWLPLFFIPILMFPTVLYILHLIYHPLETEDSFIYIMTGCKNVRCKTCPAIGNVGNFTLVNTPCKTSGVVYMIRCGVWDIKYVGQTSLALNLRINNHRSLCNNNVFDNDNKFNSSKFEYEHFKIH